MPKFLQTLRRNPGNWLLCLKRMEIFLDNNSSLLAVSVKQPRKLMHLVIIHLNLTRQHSLLARSPLARPVHTLDLIDVQQCAISHLIRFVNLFHSLTSLTILFDYSVIKLEGIEQILPPLPNHPSRRSRVLTHLRLWLIPGINMFLGWYIREETFLSKLKTLNLTWRSFPPESDFHNYFDGVQSILNGCVDTLEDLTLQFDDVPLVEGVTDICTSEYIIKSNIIEMTFTVALSSLTKLRKIALYGGASSTIISQYARRISSVSSPCKILEIELVVYTDDYDKIRDDCKHIDEALNRDKFPSLHSFQIFKEIPSTYFPNLEQRGVLKVLQWFK